MGRASFDVIVRSGPDGDCLTGDVVTRCEDCEFGHMDAIGTWWCKFHSTATFRLQTRHDGYCWWGLKRKERP